MVRRGGMETFERSSTDLIFCRRSLI